jgi:peptidoglycan/LPS O-acetylase OafA/YrhL
VSDTPPRWLPEFQYFRAFAILEIIACHVTGFQDSVFFYIPSPQREILKIVTDATGLAVSQFVFISGFVLYNKYKGDFSVRMFFKKRVSSVLWPYLIFSTFYFFYPVVFAPLAPASFSHLAGLVSLSGIQLLGAYLLGLVTGIAQMWFILLILQLYVLYPFIVKAYHRASKHQNVVVGALAMLLIVQIVYTWISIVVPHYVIEPNELRVPFISQIFYFVLAIFACDHYDSIKNKIATIKLPPLTIFVALATACYGVVYNLALLTQSSPVVYVLLYVIVQAAYALLLIVFFLKICILWREPHSLVTRWMERIGEDSFGIYLTHTFYVVVFGGLLIILGLGVADLLFYPIVFVSVLIASYLTVHLIYRLPYSNIIIGRPRKSAAVGQVA